MKSSSTYEVSVSIPNKMQYAVHTSYNQRLVCMWKNQLSAPQANTRSKPDTRGKRKETMGEEIGGFLLLCEKKSI